MAILPLLLAVGLIRPTVAQERDQRPANETGTPRVASSGLCADLMLMLLAEDQQIAGLSAQSQGPLAAFPERASKFPQYRGSAEEVIAGGADILLADSAVDQRSALVLEKFGVEVLRVSNAYTWGEVETMTRTVAAAIGQPERGEAVLADMNRRLAQLQPKTPREEWPTILYYRPDMGGAGEGSFVNTAIEAAGFRNLQAEWGPAGWGGVPIERVVYDPPDLFATSYFDTNRANSNILRRNPVLWGAARTRPVINVHGKNWNCGSPALIGAVEQLAEERRRLFPELYL